MQPASSSGGQDTRRERLQNLKKREDMKDMLLQKYSQATVASSVVGREVDRFIGSAAPMTEANLARLERRLQHQAQMGRGGAQLDADAASVCSVSAYTNGSMLVQSARGSAQSAKASSRSATQRQGPLSARASGAAMAKAPLGATSGSIPSSAGGMQTGNGIGVGDAAYNSPQRVVTNSLEWSVLDKLAAQMQKQDATRQRARDLDLQNKLREDLNRQIEDSRMKLDREKVEEQKYFEYQIQDNQKWRLQEEEKEANRKERLRIQKEERDRQIKEQHARRDEERVRQHEEGEELKQKMSQELQAERQRVENLLVTRREQTQKALEVSSQSAKIREIAQKNAADTEDKSVLNYQQLQEHRAQEALQKKKAEEGQRNVREAEGMKRAEVDKIKEQEAKAKAAAEREAKDMADVQRERAREQGLAKQRLDTQAYLLQQMRDKHNAKQAEKEKCKQQRMAQEVDAKDFTSYEHQRGREKRLRNMEHKMELERQMAAKVASIGPVQSGEAMSEVELRLNKNLLERVNQALTELTEQDRLSSA